uniref:F-box domain-containing protein n=1 Tax=Ditylenchus dipsaci TaxID=166011 RepID=A0A915D178_9BILA
MMSDEKAEKQRLQRNHLEMSVEFYEDIYRRTPDTQIDIKRAREVKYLEASNILNQFKQKTLSENDYQSAMNKYTDDFEKNKVEKMVRSKVDWLAAKNLSVVDTIIAAQDNFKYRTQVLENIHKWLMADDCRGVYESQKFHLINDDSREFLKGREASI